MSTRTSLLKRFDELISVGNFLLRGMDDTDSVFLSKKGRWQTSCMHLLEKTFGTESIYFERFKTTLHYADESQLLWEVELMNGAKEEIESGFLYKIEHLMSIDLFDSVIEQSKYFPTNGFKDVAAVLGRVVIENTLKDLARREEIKFSEKTKLSKLNESLWKKNVYAKNIWRVTQGYIDMGNYAAHGEFDKYDAKSVENMLTWITQTLFVL